MYWMRSDVPTANILAQAWVYNSMMVQQPPRVRHITVTMDAVWIHCFMVKPWARENCEPFSTK